jgi:DNA polymerase-1
MNQVVIIDGNSLLFRAYFASAYSSETLMRTQDGTPTNAIFVFANMILKLVQTIAIGDHLLVAFDTGEPTFRHVQMESYKAQRKPVPQDLILQFPIARELLKALNIFTFEKSGFEADDVAGTFAHRCYQAGHAVHLYTSDRDFLQMVNGGIKVHLIKKGVSDIREMTPDLVLTDYGITPAQVPDYKGLVGDASDNIPGIPGIGEKTAIKLLTQYGTFENVIANVANIGGKIGANITEHLEIGKLSKQLAIIHTNIELPFRIEDTAYQGFDFETIATFSKTYELRTLLNKLPNHLKKNSEKDTPFQYQIIDDLPHNNMTKIGLAIDLNGENYHKESILGIGIAFDQQAFYIPVSKIENANNLKAVLANAKIEKFGFDIKAITVAFHRLGLTIEHLAFDLMLASYTLDTNQSHKKESILQYFGITIPQVDKTDLLDPSQPELHAKTALYSLQLFPRVLQELNGKQAETLLFDVEQPLAIVLAKMEIEGFPLDRSILETMGQEYRLKLIELEKDIFTLAGKTFNVASPKQVSEILFQDLGLQSNKKQSTSVDALKSIIDDHPIVAKILEYRKYAKLISTYIDALQEHVFADGKLHAMFNQALTTTGRLSSNEPNLQNISVKDEEGKLIRKAFYYPDSTHYLLSFDYSQIELRILAELSQCKSLIEVFNHNEDIHTATAKKIFAHGSDVTSTMRRQAKAVNFGIIYGISDWGLAEQLNVPPQEARLIISQFYEAYPEIKTYMNRLIDDVQTQKYVKTILGRRRYLREINDSNYQNREFAKRAAMNAPIQGTAADLIKVAMIKIQAMLEQENFETKLVLQVHDELIFKVPKHELDIIQPKIKAIMEHALPFQVNIQVDGHYALSWYDLK